MDEAISNDGRSRKAESVDFDFQSEYKQEVGLLNFNDDFSSNSMFEIRQEGQRKPLSEQGSPDKKMD